MTDSGCCSVRCPSATRDVIIVGGGPAGLSAAIYLGRAKRDTLVIDSGKAMARWEPHVQNYLGFPDGISGDELLTRGSDHATAYGVEFADDEIVSTHGKKSAFVLESEHHRYAARRLVIATGILHIPPDIEGVRECLGHSMFFCKDCDGNRVEGKAVGVYGWTNEAVEYALAMLVYSPKVAIFTDGRRPKWNKKHCHWIQSYCMPVYKPEIKNVNRSGHQLRSLELGDGSEVFIDALFTTRGDVYFNRLAKSLGAKVDRKGEIRVDEYQETTVPGVYAAGCVTPANCQIIIAAGQGAVAAQSINRDLFEESLETHSLRRFREKQLVEEPVVPHVSA